MGFRFRKRIRLFKGLYWNLGKNGSSLSVGRRGATMNVSKKGVRDTFSLPGTGMSYQTKRVRCERVFGAASGTASRNGRCNDLSPLSSESFVDADL